MKTFPADIVQTVRQYIFKAWTDLERSLHNIIQALSDPKLPTKANNGKNLFISEKESVDRVKESLSAKLPWETVEQITIQTLPSGSFIKQHGLLYLPYNYVVPGGRFNEMYGWDSFFIVLGLLEDGKLTLAKAITDNAIYQVLYYGKVLNANRTYQLGRSHPPLLTQMIMAIYEKSQDLPWLENTLEACYRFYAFWTEPETAHFVSHFGLSRYYSVWDKPSIEVLHSELDHLGRNHYERAKEYYKVHKVQCYDPALFYSSKRNLLKAIFYRADQSSRESGFDPSSKYGPLNADILHHLPVCLNTLLYQMEIDLEKIQLILGNEEESQLWHERAIKRAKQINYYCWDEDLGYYFDYNFVTNRARPYIFATTFYPLWAGIATPEQAKRVVLNLPALEAPGGLLTSAYVTGNQWDAPFGWAPLHYFAIHGLLRYGYQKEALRVAHKFLSLIHDEFIKHQAIFEKYNVSSRTKEIKSFLKFGYESNEVGFGWTNGVYLDLLKLFPQV